MEEVKLVQDPIAQNFLHSRNEHKMLCKLCSRRVSEHNLDEHLSHFHNIWNVKVRTNLMNVVFKVIQ